MAETEMEAGRITEPTSGSWASRRREKAVMAWRHRSRNEKTMLRVIGFLSFALLCFIIAVTVMDLTYKSKIKDLQSQLDNMKTTPQAITSTSDFTDLTSDITDSTSDITDDPTTTTTIITNPPTTTTTTIITTTPAPTTTIPTTTPPAATTTAPPTTAVESSSTEEGTSSTLANNPGFLESLQSLLLSYSGGSSGPMKSGNTWQKSSELEGVVRRTHSTFAILADIHHEESKPLKPLKSLKPLQKESDPIKTSDSRNDTLVSIDTSSPLPPIAKHDNTSEITTESSRLDYEMNDTEDEDHWEGVTGQSFPIDDSSAPHEGSGAGAPSP